MSNQRQKAGDQSTNIQAASIVIHQGPSVAEVRELALDVFKSNFLVLSGIAKDLAGNRAEEITGKFLNQLQLRHPEGLSQSQNPDFQHALFTVQKEYARCGDKELGDLLVDLLVDRTKEPSRSILQIVLNEALAVASKLTHEHLVALSTVFLFRHTFLHGIRNHKDFWEYLDKHVAPLVPHLTPKIGCYQHLEYCGCGTGGLGSTNLAGIFYSTYGGLFSKGFDSAQVLAKQLEVADQSKIFTSCLNAPERQQVSAVNEGMIRSWAEKLKIGESDITKIVALYKESMMNQDEIKNFVVTNKEYMKRVFEVWDGSQMGHFTLTSVGIAIGHANLKKNLGEFTNLAIWVN